MPSQVWGREAQEAFRNPYEYDIQEQFVREATIILNKLNEKFQTYSMKFHSGDKSIKKAVWMLQLDALDSLRDALISLQEKRHRLAGKLFRDIVETMDLASFFYQNTTSSNRQLRRWYKDKTVPNKEYRNFIKNNVSKNLSDVKRRYYNDLSKFTHRTYGALLNGYGKGGGDMMWHDECASEKMMVLPETISYYYAVIASLIMKYEEEVINCQLFTKNEIEGIHNSSLESKTVSRRFANK